MFYDIGSVIEYNLTMVKGDTLSFGVEMEGLDQNLDTAFFACKKSYDDASPLFEKYLGNGIYLLEENYYGVRIAPEDTENIEPGKYHYDLEISVNGDVFTPMRGYFEILPDVTRDKTHSTDEIDFSIMLAMNGNVSVVGETLIIEEG